MTRLRPRLSPIFFFLLLVGCPWNEPPPSDTIVFAIASGPRTLDPRFATGANSQRLLKLIFSSLVTIGDNLEVAPGLAESWSYQNKVYSLKIRPDILFSNGRPLEFRDLAFSIEEFQSSGSPFASQFKVIQRFDGQYDSEKGGVLNIHLHQYSASFLRDLAILSILPHQETKLSLTKKVPLIGTGPFSMIEHDTHNFLLRRSKTHYLDGVRTPKVQIKVIKDASTRFMKLYNGKIDLIQTDVPFSKVKVFKESPRFVVHEGPGLSVNYVLLNLRHPLLAKRDVRAAIDQAINRKDLINYSLEGYADEATTLLTPAHPFSHSKLTRARSLNLKEAKQLLSGHKVTLKTSSSHSAIENGKVISHQLRQAGLDVELKSYDWGTYYGDIKSGNFELAIMKWVGVLDADLYRQSLHSQMTPPGRNRGYYANSGFDTLVDQAIREPSRERRGELYKKAQEIIFKDRPILPLWHEKQVAIAHKRVKGYNQPLSGDFSFLTKVYKENE